MTEMSAKKAKTVITEICMTFDESQVMQSAIVSSFQIGRAMAVSQEGTSCKLSKRGDKQDSKDI